MSFLQLKSPRIQNPLATPGLPIVTTAAASGVGTTSATGNGTVVSDGGWTVTERGFVWSTTANPTTADSKIVVAGTTGGYSGSLSPLSSGTAYHYRAYAINVGGTAYGDDITFSTASAGATTGNDWPIMTMSSFSSWRFA